MRNSALISPEHIDRLIICVTTVILHNAVIVVVFVVVVNVNVLIPKTVSGRPSNSEWSLK